MRQGSRFAGSRFADSRELRDARGEPAVKGKGCSRQGAQCMQRLPLWPPRV